MPFDPAPIQTPAKVGKYQKYADAMLRGCVLTPKAECAQWRDGKTCALGALFVGLHGALPDNAEAKRWGALDYLYDGDVWVDIYGDNGLCGAYQRAYGTGIAEDNNTGMDREQIAERIAAL